MELRPYQRAIVTAVRKGLAGGGAGQVRMACGSGKTIVGLRATEELLPEGGTAAVLVPSLALAAQTLTTWRAHSRDPLDAVVVCSDDTVADAALRSSELPVPVTTDAKEITEWLRRPWPAAVRLVVCTYASASRLSEAVSATGAVDMLILDEAHHLAGPAATPTRKVLAPHCLPARRRLFLTATPREYLDRSGAEGQEVVGMDDVNVFGPILGTYSFARGIAEGYLEDYRIAVIGVRDSQARELLAASVEYVEGPGSPSLQTIVAQVALGRAREQFGIRRALTFHPRVEAAAEFSRTLETTLARATPAAAAGLYRAHVHGEMDHRVRTRILERLGHTSEGWTVVSNARVLGEGVDLPAVDAVLFGHPKKSAVDISQAVGRALRRDPNVAGPSTIIVPLVVPDTGEEIGDLDAGDYETLWHVVRALRAHDESLGVSLDSLRRAGGCDGEVPARLPGKITMSLPAGTDRGFLAAIQLLLVRQTTSVWWEGYHQAVRYHEQHRHLLMPADHRTADGFRLGAWIASRRHERRQGRLSAERIELLDSLGMVWDPAAASFARYLQAAADFRAAHGHLRIPSSYRSADDLRLGWWLSKQRASQRAGRLGPQQEEALEALGMEWKIDLAAERWAAGLRAAEDYRREFGHLRVPRSHVRDDGYRLGDWLNTQRCKRRKNILAAEQEHRLTALGLHWDPDDERWAQTYALAREYAREHGHLQVPHCYTTADGTRLGSWILHQRQLRKGVKKGGISADRVDALDALGMQW